MWSRLTRGLGGGGAEDEVTADPRGDAGILLVGVTENAVALHGPFLVLVIEDDQFFGKKADVMEEVHI